MYLKFITIPSELRLQKKDRYGSYSAAGYNSTENDVRLAVINETSTQLILYSKSMQDFIISVILASNT